MAELCVVIHLGVRCSEKHRKEMKIKDLNCAKERNLPCKLQWLGLSEQKFYGQ